MARGFFGKNRQKRDAEKYSREMGFRVLAMEFVDPTLVHHRGVLVRLSSGGSALHQVPVEEIASGMIAGEPIAMEEKIVDVVGEDQLFDGDTAGAEAGDKVHGLREVNVAVVVAVDEQHGRPPGVHGGDRGRFVRELGELGGNILSVPVVRRPIVDAMEVDAGGEDVRVAAQTQGGEITAVAATPEAHPCGIDVRAALQIFSGGNDVLVFSGAAAGAAWGFAEGAAVADSAAVVYREHHVSAAGQVLIHGVGVRVVVHVVPAEEHLTHRSAMHENQSWLLLTGLAVCGKKKLAVNLPTVGGVKNHLLRRTQTI